ncbi:MAG: hypothetical protein K2X02_06665 [Alphaproteobacteria bacterium]|nr:hypothetical protein [Alphaproteobacteria bacterium]
MMIKERNKLSIVTAFIVGTTMLSAVDNAWGMDDGNDLIKKDASSKYVAAASRFFLAGTARVTEGARKAAETLLGDLEATSETALLTPEGLELRKALIRKGTRSYKDIFTLKQGGLLRVMADLDPASPLDTIVIESLRAIKDAEKEDPYDSITHGQVKPGTSAEEMNSIRQSLQKAKEEAELSTFFSAALPNLVASYPTIVDSLIARYPREEEKIEQQRRKLQSYFCGEKKTVVPKTLTNAQRNAQARQQRELQQKRENEFRGKLNALAEAFLFLKDINDKQTPPSSSSPIELEPLPSSSSSISTAPVDEPVLQANTTTFHMGVPNSYLINGFSVPEGPHRWTEGTKASITLSLQHMEPRPTSISFLDTRGLVTADYTQDLTVRVNGAEAGHYVYRPGDNHTIDISLPQVDALAEIEFEIPKAISPSELGINPDKRKLGISFREVQFQ